MTGAFTGPICDFRALIDWVSPETRGRFVTLVLKIER